ncbi:MAG: hypothetical protein WCF94_00250 [bacterium]
MNPQDLEKKQKDDKTKIIAFLVSGVFVLILFFFWIGNLGGLISDYSKRSSWQVGDFWEKTSKDFNKVGTDYNQAKDFGSGLLKKLDENSGVTGMNYNSISDALNSNPTSTVTSQTLEELPKSE